MFQGKRILTVDDSVTIRAFLQRLLTEQGATVDAATTGEEALAYCRLGYKYDLIILDLLLPDTDGIEILREIRQTNDETAIVMLTGVGGVKSAITAVQHGADGYLEKHDLNVGGDHAEFFYALTQAIQRRAGLVAQKQLSQVRADFYSMVTHDMRNPASATVMILDLLLSDYADSLTPPQLELLNMARDASRKLLGLINDYLDFAKIEAGYLKLDRQTVDLRDVVEAGVRFGQVQAQSKNQTVILDLPQQPLYACVDPERIKQVVDNLVSNAVKYTPEGGRITVQLYRDGKFALLRVSDTGQGISKAQMEVLFTKYQRLPGETARRIQGTGLGLFIVKQTVEAHGGSVWAESEGIPGKGSTFFV
ncbi:MAG: hybrid sensor histidine kinase/response regulator, partial [Anaerolineae bacterium]